MSTITKNPGFSFFTPPKSTPQKTKKRKSSPATEERYSTSTPKKKQQALLKETKQKETEVDSAALLSEPREYQVKDKIFKIGILDEKQARNIASQWSTIEAVEGRGEVAQTLAYSFLHPPINIMKEVIF